LFSFINFRNQSVNISKQFTEETNEFNPDEQKKKVAHIGVAKYFLGTQTLSSNREQEKEREKKRVAISVVVSDVQLDDESFLKPFG
jgi:hypothetical protein